MKGHGRGGRRRGKGVSGIVRREKPSEELKGGFG